MPRGDSSKKGNSDSFQKEKLCLYDLGTSPELFTENITFTALESDPERGEPALSSSWCCASCTCRNLSMPPSPEFTIAEVSATSVIAQGLGYVVGAGSLLLYTPIAIRVCRQRDASGLTLSTWWLKLISYTCSDVYSFANGYLVSTCVALVAALHTFPCSLSGT